MDGQIESDATALCLQILQEETDQTECIAALQTLLRIFRNIAQNPNEEKYRRLRKENATFHQKVWRHSGAQQMMYAAGWVEVDDAICLPDDSQVHSTIKLLESTLGSLQISTATDSRPAATSSQAPERKEVKISEERRRQLEQLKREQEEKKRISERIKADRAELRTRETRPSHARQIERGAKIKVFKDIGVDLNRGGG